MRPAIPHIRKVAHVQRITVDEKFNFVLDDEMYELARAALEEYAPEEVPNFTRERFVRRESWLLIPDMEYPGLRWYKAEFQVKHGAPYHQTVKLNVWQLPDLRKDGAPIPHNHPWPFFGHVLAGAYKEDRYEVDINRNKILVDPYQKWEVGGTSVTSDVVHQAGEINDLPLTTFHEVTEILAPNTLSLMNCDLGRKEGWGHLEDDSKGNLIYVPNKDGELDERFMPRMLELNPHRRR